CSDRFAQPLDGYRRRDITASVAQNELFRPDYLSTAKKTPRIFDPKPSHVNNDFELVRLILRVRSR
ncbi:hypothetical protein, partial [Burkholderia pyrrocinia]|uniref:hypothetical protein n=1 Tax=Burkholderia pyrrocinia TaxID=60550 RepID=UPI001ABAB0C6